MAFPTDPIYKLYKNNPGAKSDNASEDLTPKVIGVTKNCDSHYLDIPLDPRNSEYIKYLEWKAIDGNEPEAAD